MAKRYPCYICSQPFPRDQLQYNRIWAGYQGRAKTGRVLMCPACSDKVNEYWRKQDEMQRVIAVVALIIMAVTALVFYAIREH